MDKFYKYVLNAAKYMYTMFILQSFDLFIYLMSAGILVPSLSQIKVCKLWSEVIYLTRNCYASS